MSQPTPEGNSATPSSGGAPPSGAPLLLVESDLFFLVKVRDTLAAAGYRVRVARCPDDVARSLDEAPPALVLANAAGRGIDWRAVVSLARERGVPVIVYAPHIDTETQTAARAAGATRVIANSKLGADLPALVARTLRTTVGQTETRSATAGDTAPDDTTAITSKDEIAAKTATSNSPSPFRGGGQGERFAAKTAMPITLPDDGAQQQRSSRREAVDP